MTMRTLIALLAIAGSALAQDITVTNTATLLLGQQRMLERVTTRLNEAGVTALTNQYPNAVYATNVNGTVTARVDGVLQGTYRLKTVPGYALELMEANSLLSTIRAELAAKRAEDAARLEAVTAAYDEASAAVKAQINALLGL
jgi:hypothetical protein